MYIPRHYEVSDFQEVARLLQDHPFGQLISHHQGRLMVTHLPFRLNRERRVLSMHLAKNNPQWRDIDGQEVMVSVVGAHGYVSPTWYEKPGVPTWNYQAVHVYGHCTVVTEPSALRVWMEEMNSDFEPGGLSLDEVPHGESKLRGIVGLELEISSVEAKYKLSQNRTDVDRVRVIDALRQQGNDALASAMATALAGSEVRES